MTGNPAAAALTVIMVLLVFVNLLKRSFVAYNEACSLKRTTATKVATETP